MHFGYNLIEQTTNIIMAEQTCEFIFIVKCEVNVNWSFWFITPAVINNLSLWHRGKMEMVVRWYAGYYYFVVSIVSTIVCMYKLWHVTIYLTGWFVNFKCLSNIMSQSSSNCVRWGGKYGMFTLEVSCPLYLNMLCCLWHLTHIIVIYAKAASTHMHTSIQKWKPVNGVFGRQVAKYIIWWRADMETGKDGCAWSRTLLYE